MFAIKEEMKSIHQIRVDELIQFWDSDLLVERLASRIKYTPMTEKSFDGKRLPKGYIDDEFGQSGIVKGIPKFHGFAFYDKNGKRSGEALLEKPVELVFSKPKK